MAEETGATAESGAFRHLPGRPVPPDRRLRRGQADRGRRLRRRGARRPDVLRPAGLQFRRSRRHPRHRPRASSPPSNPTTMSSRRPGPAAACSSYHYAGLFGDDPAWKARAEAFGAKVFELVSFLTDVRGMKDVAARFPGTVTYHNSCAGLRELGIRDQPRKLLASVDGLETRRAEGCQCLLRLRRHLLRQVSRHLECHRREEDRGDRRLRAPRRCSPATWAA